MHSPACGDHGTNNVDCANARGVEDRAGRRHPRTVRVGRAEEGEDRERRVGLRELREPRPPIRPRGAAGRRASRSPGTRISSSTASGGVPARAARRGDRRPRVGRTRRRSWGGTRSAGRAGRGRSRLDERDHVAPSPLPRGGRTKPSVNSDEPLISNASLQPSKTRARNIERERRPARAGPTRPRARRARRRVERHDPVAGLVGAQGLAERLGTHRPSDRYTNRVTNDDAPREARTCAPRSPRRRRSQRRPRERAGRRRPCSHGVASQKGHQSSGSGGRRRRFTVGPAALLIVRSAVAAALGSGGSARRRDAQTRGELQRSTLEARGRGSGLASGCRRRPRRRRGRAGRGDGRAGVGPTRRTRRPGTRPRPGCRWCWRAARPVRRSGSPASRAPRGECDRTV